MEKQTAVDYAFEKLASQGLLITKDYKNLVAYKEAKEMEKKRIIDFGYDIADKLACGVYPDKKAIEELHDEFFKLEE
jgi:hypothetical protein